MFKNQQRLNNVFGNNFIAVVYIACSTFRSFIHNITFQNMYAEITKRISHNSYHSQVLGEN